jgi:SET domain-containing protein
MLLVNASRGPSRIHGTGLIAQEFIAAGTRIWKFREGFDVEIAEDQARALSTFAIRQLRFYAYFDLSARVFILSSDDDRYTNHSAQPNTEYIDFHTVANCDISKGEEITCDYEELGWTEFLGVPAWADAPAPS